MIPMTLSPTAVLAVAALLILSQVGCAGRSDPVDSGPVDEQAVPAIVAGNTEFALDLYARLRTGDGNRFVSPYSLSTVLAMTYAGARGATAEEMAATLHFPAKSEELDLGFHALIRRINAHSRDKTPPYLLTTANALWGQSGEPFLPGFLDRTRASYGASLQVLDFAADRERAASTINRWAETQTGGKIKDLLPVSALDANTSLVLTNAVYFKGDWKDKFAEVMTKNDDVFLAPGGRKVAVAMMRQTHQFRQVEGETFQALELPYAGDDLSMVVLLPKTADGLAELEAALTPANLTDWLGKLTSATVAVELPRFTLTERVDLKEVLMSMGMRSAFDLEKADFTGMRATRDLFLSAVLQKAFVDVNEKGTEAAAAAAVAVGKRAMPIGEPKLVRFRADHPFVFLIRDLRTGTLLFLGRLVDPKS